MNPDQTPAHLPALLPHTAALLLRAQGALGLLVAPARPKSAVLHLGR
ncbi:hypothetical protein QMK33_12125 [Hymenobacter sp. H14-R3]|nr:hypothetical protein [Hymenobacter sp. H14-R3]MDJ0365901.1 hypothetical protein [Hymenobacter sp. H14-R3]